MLSSSVPSVVLEEESSLEGVVTALYRDVIGEMHIAAGVEAEAESAPCGVLSESDAWHATILRSVILDPELLAPLGVGIQGGDDGHVALFPHVGEAEAIQN